MKLTQPYSIAIIGGGIAGLSAAYYAAQKAIAQKLPVQVHLFEAASYWGGKIVTDRIDWNSGQFIIEGGPDTFLASKPWGVALCKELNLTERLQGTNPHQRNTYVLHHGRLLLLPDGLALMIPSDISSVLRSRLLNMWQKARMGLDFITPPRQGNEDESLGSFISRRLGRAAYENLIEPLMSGIYAGDGDQLSLASTFPYLHDLETKYGSLARGALAMRKTMGGKGWRSAFFTPTLGLNEIIDALVDKLVQQGVKLHLNNSVNYIQEEGSGSSNKLRVITERDSELVVDAVILAASAPHSGHMLQRMQPALAALLQSIAYTSTATISLAYRSEDLTRALDGYGYVIPRREGRRALACTWTSTKFPHRAPAGYALLRVFVGRAGQDAGMPRTEEELLALAKEELLLSLGITASPLLFSVFFWENAMPQYNLGHPEKLLRIEAALKDLPNIALAGNGYRGIGIPDCIHSGEQAAERVLKNAIDQAY